jgi:outer membrane immunogenic protein
MSKTKLISSVAGFAALLASGVTAQAADMYTPMAEPVPSVWTGFYLGAHAGYNWANYQGIWDPSESPAMTGGDFDLNGFSGGLHVGYNWQSDSIVFGVEGDVTGANMADFWDHKDPATGAQFTSSMGANIDLLASIRGRLGLASGNSLFYITGGVAFASAKFDACDPRDCGNWDVADVGGVVGGGWEYKPASQVSMRLEGLYYIFDSSKNLEDNRFDVDDNGNDFRMGLDDAFVIRAGVTWHPWN